MTVNDLSKDEQVLYRFFMTFGQAVGTIGYPIAILSCWTDYEEDDLHIAYPEKQAVIDAYCQPDVMDKPLYLAIKNIKGWE